MRIDFIDLIDKISAATGVPQVVYVLLQFIFKYGCINFRQSQLLVQLVNHCQSFGNCATSVTRCCEIVFPRK